MKIIFAVFLLAFALSATRPLSAQQSATSKSLGVLNNSISITGQIAAGKRRHAYKFPFPTSPASASRATKPPYRCAPISMTARAACCKGSASTARATSRNSFSKKSSLVTTCSRSSCSTATTQRRCTISSFPSRVAKRWKGACHLVSNEVTVQGVARLILPSAHGGSQRCATIGRWARVG